MEIKAQQKSIRISPRKLRLVANSIRHLSASTALETLNTINKQAVLSLKKCLNQAIANATNNHKLNEKDLFINQILINEGPTYKRWQPVSRGRAHSILKRTSHIIITLKNTENKISKSQTANTKQPQASHSK